MAHRTTARTPLSADALRRLKQGRDQLSAGALARIHDDLPWFRALPAQERSWVGLVAQAGITAFITWCENPAGAENSATEIFTAAPPELTRTVSLHQTLQLVRACVETVEDLAESTTGHSSAELREAVLRYSREVAFSAAEVYARAAEARGSWDARLEALVLDGVMRGESAHTLNSRAAALGWRPSGPAIAIVASPSAGVETFRLADIRRHARKAAPDCLVGLQGDHLLIVLHGGDGIRAAATQVAGRLPPGPVVIGPQVEGLERATASLRAALAGAAAIGAWPDAPRPVLADELLPERALAADPEARTTLHEAIYLPLQQAGGELTRTMSAYATHGRSLEGSARVLYVHPNTVRYRLKRITEVTGWDPSDPREAFVLHVALLVGRLVETGAL